MQTEIVLQVNSNPVININLAVGQVTQTIEVQANAAQVETRSTAVGTVIENARILELPLNGRNVTDLIVLSGAAVQTGQSSTTSFRGGRQISVAGGLEFGVMYSLDGATHNNVYDGTQMPLPFPDALQEFKVEASGMGAAGGTRGSGGHVSAVTRSGTNDFHGDAFWFVRNYKFNARNFFARERDSLKRNQYGGTIGGPIVANRLFFFGGYQGTKTRSDPSSDFDFVPTPAMLAGDFRDFASAACNRSAITLGAPFVDNQIDPSLFEPIAVRMSATLPASENGCGRSTFGAVVKDNEGQIVGKVDFQATPVHSLFGRFMMTTLDRPTPYSLSQNVLVTNEQGFDNSAFSYALGSTYLLGTSTVNAFRMSINRTRILRAGAHFWSAPSMGVNGYSEVDDHALIRVTGGGGFSTGARADSNFATTAYQIGDDLNFLRGNHQVTIGFNAAHWRTLQRAHTQDVGRYDFDGSFTGLGMADFLLGSLENLEQQQPVQWSSRQTYIAAYVADTWQARSNLSLSYGLRWEPFITLQITEGAVYQFDIDRFNAGTRSTVYPGATPPTGLYYNGDPGFPSGTKPVNNRWGLMAPRVGLAWDVQGDGRTSVRASYGIAYDFSGSSSFGGSSSSPPWGFSTDVESPAGGFADPWRDFRGGIPFPLDRSTPKWADGARYYYTADWDSTPPTVHSWNLSVQREIPADFLLTASYLGNQMTHLWTRENTNDAVFIPGVGDANGNCFLTDVGQVIHSGARSLIGQTVPYTVRPGAACTRRNTDARRVLALLNPTEASPFGRVSLRTDGGTQQYHGLLLSLQRRAAEGVNIGMNYTWSHCVGDAPNANASGVGGTGFLDPNDRARDRANCESDRRQLFNMTAVASTPEFANPTLRMVATGWQLSSIYRYSTGNYLTIQTGTDRLASGQRRDQRVDQVGADPYGDRDSLNNFLNPASFAQPSSGIAGTSGRSVVEGSRTWQLDVSLSRRFALGETQDLEFRVEAFNLTNSLIRDNPNASFNSSRFGRITSGEDARVMQFALKYAF